MIDSIDIVLSMTDCDYERARLGPIVPGILIIVINDVLDGHQ